MAEAWDELAALGKTVRDPVTLADAMSVAYLTMERVATNIERLIARLASHGYEFGIRSDGTSYPLAASTKPNAEFRVSIAELEHSAGTIPLSLRGFWDVVGSVSLIGRLRGGWPDYSDPLVVEDPMAALADFREWHADPDVRETKKREGFPCLIAPDFLHKDNVSGGRHTPIELPNPGADAPGRWGMA